MPKTTLSAETRKDKQKRTAGSERTIQSSISLRPALWDRIDVLADLTQWGRSGAIAQAAELFTSLPVPVTQRWATLNRTRVRDILQRRLGQAVQDAIAEAEAELPQDPWAEFDAALIAIGDDVRQNETDRLSEQALIKAADTAKRQVRRRRRTTR